MTFAADSVSATPTHMLRICVDPPTAPPFEKRRAKTLLCLVKVLLLVRFSVCTFFSVSCNETDKNAQSRRISVSSPYNRTAETDFGERKSEI